MNIDQIKVIGVVGAGTMASGIAESFAEGGYKVIQYNRSQSGLDRSLNLIRSNQKVLVENGALSKEKAQAALERTTQTLRLEDVAEADFISESIIEKIEDKQEIFRKIDSVCRNEAIFTTDTSGLSITKIGSAVSNPSRFAGMHWWNPPHIIPLVEVIKGEQSSEETCQATIELCKRIGKKPVYVKKDIPGFIGNRMQLALVREMLYMLDEGVAAPEDIDTVIKYGPGPRWALMGPVQIADLAGLDTVNFVCSYLLAELNNAKGSPKVLQQKIEKGELGAKAGKGFYNYSGDEATKLVEWRNKKLLEILKLQGN